MPDPKAHDQPAEGGKEAIEHTLQKNSEPKENRKPAAGANLDKRNKTDKSRQDR